MGETCQNCKERIVLEEIRYHGAILYKIPNNVLVNREGNYWCNQCVFNLQAQHSECE